MTNLVSNYEQAIIASAMLVAHEKNMELSTAERYIRQRLAVYRRLGYSIADAIEQIMLDCDKRTGKQIITLADDYQLHSRYLSPEDACVLKLELANFFRMLPAKAQKLIKKSRYTRYLYQTVYKYLSRYRDDYPTIASPGNRSMVLEYLYRYAADCIY